MVGDLKDVECPPKSHCIQAWTGSLAKALLTEMSSAEPCFQ